MEQYIPRTEIIDSNNNWTNSLEHLVRKWGENSKGYSWIHNHISIKYHNYHNYFNVTQISLAGLASLGNFSNVECTSYLAWSLGIISMGSFIISGVITFKEFNDNSILHKDASSKFKGLAGDIEYQLSINRLNRQNGEEFISECKEVYDSLIANSPRIPDWAIEKYKKKFGKSNISHPEIVDTLEHIKIEGNPTPPSDDDQTPKIRKIVTKWKSEKNISKNDFK
jgi:hypothetical protein